MPPYQPQPPPFDGEVRARLTAPRSFDGAIDRRNIELAPRRIDGITGNQLFPGIGICLGGAMCM